MSDKRIEYTIISGDYQSLPSIVDEFLNEYPKWQLYGFPFAAQEYDEDSKRWIPSICQALIIKND